MVGTTGCTGMQGDRFLQSPCPAPAPIDRTHRRRARLLTKLWLVVLFRSPVRDVADEA